MKQLNILTLCLFSLHLSHSQINEIGIFMGGSNFIGDVGSTNYIFPNSPALGVIYKWNASPRHSWRATLLYSDLKANDIDSDDPRRILRGYQFESNILEVSAGIEFTFFDFDLHARDRIATPYIHTGISAAKHDNHYFFNGIQTPENKSSWAYGLPITLGYKANLLNSIILAIEVSARYTLSDEIDGSIPSTPSNYPYQFGNINNNDWYMFSGITLTYTFGENPCYCPSSN